MLKNYFENGCPILFDSQEAVFHSEERLEILVIKLNTLMFFSYFILAQNTSFILNLEKFLFVYAFTLIVYCLCYFHELHALNRLSKYVYI